MIQFDDGSYDSADETPRPPEGFVVAERGADEAIILQHQRCRDESATPVHTQTIQGFYLPVGLLGVGILVAIFYAVEVMVGAAGTHPHLNEIFDRGLGCRFFRCYCSERRASLPATASSADTRGLLHGGGLLEFFFAVGHLGF